MPEDVSSRTHHDRFGHVMGNDGSTASKTAAPVQVGEQKEYSTREKPSEKSSDIVMETVKSCNTKELRVSSSTAGANASPARHSVESGDMEANVDVLEKSEKSAAMSATAIVTRSTPEPSKTEMAGVEELKLQKSDTDNPTKGWTKINGKKQKPETKSVLERLHEPAASVSPRSLAQNMLATSWTIWDHQPTGENPKAADWDSSMREVANVSTVEEFWVNWSYIPSLR